MPPVPASGAAELALPAALTPAALLDAYQGHLEGSGRGNSAYASAARTFLARWSPS
jgi:hypothetical protein